MIGGVWLLIREWGGWGVRLGGIVGRGRAG